MDLSRENASAIKKPAAGPVAEEVFAFPLAFAQQRLWVLDRLQPNTTAYNLPLPLRLRGALNRGALDQALTEVMRRHEVLRATFSEQDGAPVQIIPAPARVLHIPVTDLSSLPRDARESEARTLARKDIQTPFDLGQGPVLRMALLKLGDDDHVLLLNVHHIVFDGWSRGILLRELVALYQAFSAGQPSPLPEPAIQYTDYAVWQREYLTGPTLDKQLNYWKQQLAGAPSSLELPTDYPRPTVQTFGGASHSLLLPTSLAASLKELSRKQGATLFMTLVAAFNVLMARYSGQEDIVLGSPIAGRQRAEMENLIGFFVNTLVLRTDLSGNPSFRQLLERVRETALQAYAHQDLPFEKLVEQLKPERDLSRNPVFQVMFALQNIPHETDQISDLKIEPFRSGQGTTAKFDLSVTMVDKPDGLWAAFEYNTSLFTAATIQRMGEHFQILLQGVAADPSLPIHELPILSAGERQQLITDFNRTDTAYSRELCVHQLFEEQVARTPESVAVVFGNERLSYGELNRRANRLARYLERHGVAPEVLVGICLERSLDMLVATLAIMKAGGAYVPLDPAYPKERVAFILQDAKASVLLTQASLREDLPSSAAEIVTLDAAFMAMASGGDGNVSRDVTAQNLAYALYTSGSTGKPKGVQIQHRSVTNFLCSMQREPGISERDALLAVTTLSFDIAGLELYLPLTVGGRVVIASREEAQDGQQLMAKLEEESITLMQATPATWRLLLESGWRGKTDLKILCGGEAFPRELAEQLLPRCAELWNMYGPTETTIWSTIHRVMEGENGPVSIGRPIANTELYVLNAYWQPVPIGVGGELYIGGDGLARGYLNRPELTAEKFVAHRFRTEPGRRLYRTGDLVRFQPDGNLVFLGRIDNQVKIRGFRVELGEIESILSRHPAVQQAVVIMREDVPGDQRLVGYIVAQPGQDPAGSELKTHLEQSLPDYMVPGMWVKLDTLPLTPNGKINRRALPKPEIVETSSDLVGPRDEFESVLLPIWERLLGTGSIGVTDNFFDLGGHSLLAVRLLSEIKKATGKEIPLIALFQGATVEYLAKLLREGTTSVPHVTVTEIQRGGSRATFFAAVVPGVNALGYIALAKYLGTDQPFYMLQGPGPRIWRRPYTAREFDAMAADYVRAMREVQPEGPYHIGGMCEGARIAFDMARLLESQGQKVVLLAVFDTWVLENTQNRLLWYFHYYWQRLRVIRRLSTADKRRALSKGLRNSTKKLLRPSGTTTGNDWPSAYWPGKDFVPPKFNGKITVFKSPKQPFYYVRDPLMGWGARTTVGVEVRLVSARHLLMLREPYVRDLAAKLSEGLERTRSQAAKESEYRNANAHDAIFPLVETGQKADSSCPLVAKQLDVQVAGPAIARHPGRNGGPPEPFPLSFGQQRLWVLDRLEPDSPAYNMPLGVRLTGSLNFGAFENALHQVVERHEILRTEFHSENGEPVQVVLPAANVPLALVDLRGLPPAEREAQAMQLAIAEARKSFNLGRGPLLRASLLRLAKSEHILLVTAHQIAFDEWSVETLLAEMAQFYEAAVRGEASVFSQLPFQYGDFAVWQRRMLQGEQLQQQLSYWKQKLAGAPPSVALPTDRPRELMQTFRGSSQAVVLAESVVQRLRDLAGHQGTTLFMTLLAGFNVLLSRYSGQDDVVVGTPVAGRIRPELEKPIGLFGNTLALRTDLSGDPSFVELLHRVREATMGAYAHQDVPFERLVEELKPERDMSRNPLFQIMFSMQNVPGDGWQMPGLILAPFKVETGTEKFDLSVSLLETGSGLKATFSYNRDLFAATTIARMMDHFRTVLEGLVANPARRISELPLLPESERRKVLVEFNQTAADFRRDLCLHNFFETQVECTPGATALICEQERLTYRELNTRANRLAHYLRKRGVEPEVLVGICVERSVDMLVGILAILKAGGAYVPLDPAYPKDRLAAILEDAKAPILLTQQALLDLLPQHTAAVICLDTDRPEIAREPAENPVSNLKPENLGYVLFTSGSTGRPKGVAVEQRSVATFIQWAQRVFTPEEVAGTLFSTSMCFDLSVFEVFVPLSMGGTVILAQNALILPKLPAANQVTLINTVPSLIAELLRMDGVPSSVQVVNLAGEALPTSLAQQIYEKTQANKVYNLYGPTEDTTYSTYTLVPRGGEVTIGRPLPNTQVYILDANRQPTPIGVPGELHLAGDGLARGYFGRPDLTAERFLPNPFSTLPGASMYRTGDLARFLPDGHIQYLGRIDNQVKVRGFRIELGEIETVLSEHPSVQECVVIVREDTPGDKRLVAYTVPSPEQDVSGADLRSLLKQRLPEFMIPSAFVNLEALPRTPNGKINRRALPPPDWSQMENLGRVAARDQIEAMLVEIWQNVLGIPNLGVHDNFFDLGGHSLLAARLLSEVETLIGRQIPLSALFRAASVESLAQLIRDGAEARPDPLLMEIQPGNGGLPFFAIASPGVESLGYALLARHMGTEQAVYKLQGRAPAVTDRPFTDQELHTLAEEYIAAMRAVQPQGPYCFGGMCEGVQIAERMVLDLEAQGQEVGLFAIFDTWVLQHSQRPWLWRLDYYRQRLRELGKMGLAEQFQEYKRAVKQRLSGKSPNRIDWQQAYWPEDFTPPRFRAPIALFKRPRQPFYYVNDPQMGWGGRSEGGVEIYEVDFHHLEILREPHVRLLGEHLAACVERASKRHAQSALCDEAASLSLSGATRGGTG